MPTSPSRINFSHDVPRDAKLQAVLLSAQEVLELFHEICTECVDVMGARNVPRLHQLYPLLLGVGSTGASILHLLESGFPNEATMLFRAFLERVHNFNFALIGPDSEFEAFVAYSKQKGLRRHHRAMTDGTTAVSLTRVGPVDVSREQIEALRTFTGPKGGEKTRWTKTSLVDRASHVARRLGRRNSAATLIGLLAVYEVASEALHGTLFGALFHTGYYDGPTQTLPTGEGLTHAIASHETLLGSLLVGHLHDTISLLSRVTEVEHYESRSQVIVDDMTRSIES